MKRTIKRQLKEDEFVSGMTKFMNFVKTWEREFIIAGVVVFAAVIVFLGFQLLREQQVKKDSQAAGDILALRAGLAKNPQDTAKLEAAAAKGKYASLAAISLATHWVEQGQPDKAQAALARVRETPKNFYYYQAQDLAAQVAILKGEYDRAIAILKKIEEAKPKDYILDAVLFHRAEALEKKGQGAEALALYKKLRDEYAQSYYGYDASMKVQKLEAGKLPRP